jgi:hypothetical protein
MMQVLRAADGERRHRADRAHLPGGRHVYGLPLISPSFVALRLVVACCLRPCLSFQCWLCSTCRHHKNCRACTRFMLFSICSSGHAVQVLGQLRGLPVHEPRCRARQAGHHVISLPSRAMFVPLSFAFHLLHVLLRVLRRGAAGAGFLCVSGRGMRSARSCWSSGDQGKQHSVSVLVCSSELLCRQVPRIFE